MKKQSKTKRANECAFCGPTPEPLSVEDIWPRWLSTHLRRSRNVKHFYQQLIRNRGSAEKGRGQRVKLEAPIVCRDCNNTWMSEMENLVKPLLVPLIANPSKRQTLSDVDCLTIASWATLKAILMDHLSVHTFGTEPFFSTEQRKNFKATCEPPFGVGIFVGRLETKRPQRPTGDVQTLYYSEFKSESQKHLRAYVFTFSVNEVAVQVCAVKSIVARGRLPRRMRFVQQPMPGTWPDYVPPIWPEVPRTLQWPPARQLGSLGFDFLAHRFGRMLA